MKKRVGIWGFGVTGKAAAQYFKNQGYLVWIMDASQNACDQAKQLGFSAVLETEQERFFFESDFLISSGGVDLIDVKQHYAIYANKWIYELDFFHTSTQSKESSFKLVSITGSVGKTTVTHLLSKMLTQHGQKWQLGGNIGIPLFTLLEEQSNLHKGAILEVSSYQLEHTKVFTPYVSILTNIYPNHLDRHKTMDAYIKAKMQPFLRQKAGTHAIVPVLQKELLFALDTRPITERPHYSFFSDFKPNDFFLKDWNDQEGTLFYIHNNCVMRYKDKKEETLFSLAKVPEITFVANWMILGIAALVLDITINDFILYATTVTVPEHRVEFVTSYKNTDFYNDSKSTVSESTIAAVKRLQNKYRQIILLLGGMSKGVDRTPLITELKDKVSVIYCFGKEANLLHELCKKNKIPSFAHKTLKDAFDAALLNINHDTCILLSPAGSSYDLFANYQERGNAFKQLVIEHIQKKEAE